jgi:hypothetical protein
MDRKSTPAVQRWEANNYTVDDTSTNGLARNGTTSLTANAESVEEIRITANNFSAVEGAIRKPRFK